MFGCQRYFCTAEGDGTLHHQFVYVIVKVSGYVDNDDYVLDVGIFFTSTDIQVGRLRLIPIIKRGTIRC